MEIIRTPFRAPQANGVAERFVRTVRSECLDWLLILNDQHLARVLDVFVDHYNGHRYIDGGARSVTNADLAAGCDRVLVITPSQPAAPQPWGDLDSEIEQLSPAGVRVVYANEASVAAFGTNPLSPSTRGPAAREGREIGRSEAAAIGSFWL